MAKNQNIAPLVTSVSTRLKKTIGRDTQVVTPEEIKEKKKTLLDIVDGSVKVFAENLANGLVDMSTSLDLERLVKLTLLLSGEADSVTGKPYGEKEEETTVETQSLSMSKIDEILDLNDKTVKELYDKIYQGYNELNDVDE